MADKEEVVPKEGVEEKLSDLKIDEAPADAPAEKAVETPAAEETKEESKEESVEVAPSKPPPHDPKAVEENVEVAPSKVLEVVNTVDAQNVAPDATADTPTHENPTQVVHINED